MKLIYPILPDGRFKALTLSFDDGRVQDRRLVTLLNRCGIKATFNLNSGEQGENRIPLCEYAALYAGHEIAAHGVRHPGMTAAPLPLAAQQVLEDRRALEHHTQAPVRGFAYPYGEVNAAVAAMLPALGIRYARTTQDTGRFDCTGTRPAIFSTIWRTMAESFCPAPGCASRCFCTSGGIATSWTKTTAGPCWRIFAAVLAGRRISGTPPISRFMTIGRPAHDWNFLPMPTVCTTQAVVTAGCMWTGRPSALPPGRQRRCKKGESNGKPDF